MFLYFNLWELLSGNEFEYKNCWMYKILKCSFTNFPEIYNHINTICKELVPQSFLNTPCLGFFPPI